MVPEGSVGCWLSTGSSDTDPPDLSSGPHHPGLLFVILYALSCLPSTGAPIDCRDQALVHWPIRRAPGFLADSTLFLAERVLLIFTARYYAGPGALGWEYW